MNRQHSFLALILPALASIPIGSTSILDAQEVERVVVHRELGQPLDELIQPGDKIIRIETRGGDPPLVPQPPRRESASRAAERLARGADPILIVELTDRASDLTPARDGITSVFTGRILEVLKSTSPLQVGAMVSLEQEGGEVRIGDCLVRMLPAWEEEYRVGRKYLVSFVKGSARAFEVTADGKLKDWDLIPYSPQHLHPFGGANAQAVFERIRKTVKRK